MLLFLKALISMISRTSPNITEEHPRVMLERNMEMKLEGDMQATMEEVEISEIMLIDGKMMLLNRGSDGDARRMYKLMQLPRLRENKDVP